MYAATWQMKRNGYRMDSGGPDSKLYKSSDGGDTWTDISTHSGLPKGPWGLWLQFHRLTPIVYGRLLKLQMEVFLDQTMQAKPAKSK